MESLKEFWVVPVSDPRFRAIKEGGQYDGSKNTDLHFDSQVFVVPHTLVQPAKCTVCLCKFVVDLPVNFRI